jgi:hypothetical protein
MNDLKTEALKKGFDSKQEDFYLWMCELQKWLRVEHKNYIIPKPILGSKNGYDSFPIIGWDYDDLITNINTDNSYWMGYPIGDWFQGCVDKEEIEDGYIDDIFETNGDFDYEKAMYKSLLNALKSIKINYGKF